MKLSKQNSLIAEDWQKWLKNAAIFLIPVVIVFLGEVITIIPDDWQYGALTLYAINIAVDLLKKYTQAKKYK